MMKVDVAKYVASCGVWQLVMAEYKRLVGLLQSLEVPKWPWDDVAIHFFLVVLPLTRRGKEVGDRLTNVAHFMPTRTTDLASELALIYVHEIVRLHGVPKKTITSDRDAKFVARFWESWQSAMGRHLRTSTTFLPQTNVQSEHVPFKLWNICCGIVSYLVKGAGRIIYRLWSLLTITFIKLAFRWHLMRPCMEGSVGLQYVGM
jgi:hypothetical protein